MDFTINEAGEKKINLVDEDDTNLLTPHKQLGVVDLNAVDLLCDIKEELVKLNTYMAMILDNRL